MPCHISNANNTGLSWRHFPAADAAIIRQFFVCFFAVSQGENIAGVGHGALLSAGFFWFLLYDFSHTLILSVEGLQTGCWFIILRSVWQHRHWLTSRKSMSSVFCSLHKVVFVIVLKHSVLIPSVRLLVLIYSDCSLQIQSCRLKHVESLWLLLSYMRSRMLANNGQVSPLLLQLLILCPRRLVNQRLQSYSCSSVMVKVRSLVFHCLFWCSDILFKILS